MAATLSKRSAASPIAGSPRESSPRDARPAHRGTGQRATSPRRTAPRMPAQLTEPHPLFTAYVPPTLVLNPALQVLAQVGSDVSPYLRRSAFRPGERIEVLLQPHLLPYFMRLLAQADGSTAAITVASSPHLPGTGRPETGRPDASRARGHDGPTLRLRRDEGLLFLTFEHAERPHARASTDPSGASAPHELRQELDDARATIAHVVDALDHAHAEFERISKAMHDSNAQLEHANAALEAMNEELLDANDRLTHSKAALEGINVELNGILANQGFATFLVDAALRLQRFNPSAADLFGLRSGDVGQPFAPRRTPIDALEAQVRRCIARNEGATFQVHRDDRYLLVQINLVADKRQSCSGAIVSCVDETSVRVAERTLERQLRQSQKMQAIGQLTGGIAHDFNNILASIMGYADLLASALARPAVSTTASACMQATGHEAGAEGGGNAVRYLGEILRASDRARGLIQQLLLYSHGGGGRPEPIDVPRLIDESLSMLRSVFPATIELHTDYAANLGRIYIDPVQANQVVMNLAINARDAMNGRGRIRLCADEIDTEAGGEAMRCASCHADHRGRYIRLRVTDNGPGLGDGVLEHVFEPFFTTKDVGQGTGLGLSVVHGIVHEHGGHIAVTSDANGTSFDLLFPDLRSIHAAPGQAHMAADADAGLPAHEDSPWRPPGEAPTVLIVDDEVSLADMLRELLAIHGYRASTCHDAEAALERLRHETFGCVLSDLTMPGMSGTEFAEALLQVRPDIPLCLYTGNRLLVDERTLAQLPNVRALLDKPVETRTLLRALRSMTASAPADTAVALGAVAGE